MAVGNIFTPDYIEAIKRCPQPGKVIFSKATGKYECVSPIEVNETVIVRPEPESATPASDNTFWYWIFGAAVLLVVFKRR